VPEFNFVLSVDANNAVECDQGLIITGAIDEPTVAALDCTSPSVGLSIDEAVRLISTL